MCLFACYLLLISNSDSLKNQGSFCFTTDVFSHYPAQGLAYGMPQHSFAEKIDNGRNSVYFVFKMKSVSSVAQWFPTLCDPMNCNMPGFPVHHQLLKLAQTHVRWVCDAIQPSHPLLSPLFLKFSTSEKKRKCYLFNRWNIFFRLNQRSAKKKKKK